MKRGVDQLARLRRAVDVDRLRRAGLIQGEEIVGHHVGEAEIVVRMKVRQEDSPDRLGRDARLEHASHRTDAAVDQIWPIVHDEQRRRRRAVSVQRRTATGAEEQQLRGRP